MSEVWRSSKVARKRASARCTFKNGTHHLQPEAAVARQNHHFTADALDGVHLRLRGGPLARHAAPKRSAERAQRGSVRLGVAGRSHTEHCDKQAATQEHFVGVREFELCRAPQSQSQSHSANSRNRASLESIAPHATHTARLTSAALQRRPSTRPDGLRACRSAEAQGFRSVSHALVLSNLSDAARAAIVAGTLLVPGGYPEDWATVAGAPFPPLAVARAAPPPPAQASSDDGTATSESAADAPAYDEAAAPSEAEAEAAPPPPPAADAGRPVLSARRPKRGSIAELQRVVNFFAPDVAAGGRTTRGGAAIGGEAAQHATGRKRTRSMRLSDIDVPVATAVAPAATRAAPDAVALHFPTTAGKAAQAEGGAAPRWQVRKARRIAPA